MGDRLGIPGVVGFSFFFPTHPFGLPHSSLLFIFIITFAHIFYFFPGYWQSSCKRSTIYLSTPYTRLTLPWAGTAIYRLASEPRQSGYTNTLFFKDSSGGFGFVSMLMAFTWPESTSEIDLPPAAHQTACTRTRGSFYRTPWASSNRPPGLAVPACRMQVGKPPR